jgi:hypothetical protein
MRIFYSILAALVLSVGTAGVAYADTAAPVLASHNNDVLCPLVGGVLNSVVGSDCGNRNHHRGTHWRGTDSCNVGACGNSNAVFVPVPVSTNSCGACDTNSSSYQVQQVPVGAVETGDGSCFSRFGRTLNRWGQNFAHRW